MPWIERISIASKVTYRFRYVNKEHKTINTQWLLLYQIHKEISCVVSTFEWGAKIKFLNFQVNAYLLHLDRLILHINTTIRTIVDMSSCTFSSFIIKFIHVEETAVYREDEGKIIVREEKYLYRKEVISSSERERERDCRWKCGKVIEWAV